MEGNGPTGPEVAIGVVSESVSPQSPEPVTPVVPALDADSVTDQTTVIPPTMPPGAPVSASEAEDFDAGSAVPDEKLVVDAGPSEESPPAEIATEQAETLDPRAKEVGIQQSRALGVITDVEEKNGFTQEQLSIAEAVQSSGATDIKALMDGLKISMNFAKDHPLSLTGIQEIYNDISQNVIITSGGRTYNLGALEAERAGANDVRKAQIDAIIRGGEYKLSFDAGELIDGAVNQQVESLTAKVAEAERAGRDVRKEKEILGRLKGLTGGQARHAIAISSFKQLQSMGVTGLDKVIKGGADLEAVSIEKIKETLRSNNYTESQIVNILMPQILNGNVAALMEGEVLKKPGVDLLFFEKSKSEKELQEWMKSMYPEDAEALWKKHGKNGAIAILMLIAIGVYPNVKKMLIPS